jgi:hypothetical protein
MNTFSESHSSSGSSENFSGPGVSETEKPKGINDAETAGFESPRISDAETAEVEHVEEPKHFDKFSGILSDYTDHGVHLIRKHIRSLDSMISNTDALGRLIDETVDFVTNGFAIGYLMDLEDMVRELHEDEKSFEWFEDVLSNFSVESAHSLLKHARKIGTENVSLFVRERGAEWAEHPEHRGAILEEFLIDHAVAIDLAKQKIAAKVVRLEMDGKPLQMPEGDGDLTLAIELEMPSLEFDPGWYSLDTNKYYSFSDDDDDSDYELPSELKRYDTLSKSPRRGDLLKLYSALKKGELDEQEKLIESIAGLGQIPPEKFEQIKSALDVMAQVWGIKEGESEEVKKIQEKLENVRKNVYLPHSAGSFDLHHKQLDRSRKIPSFGDVLEKQLMETLVTAAIHHARVGDEKYTSMAETLVSAELQARKMYQEVVERGVPVFKDYVRWINKEAVHAQETGGEHPGEFYVGRDAYQTLYPAAKAMRWGTMPGGERNKLTVFVNVSRPLLANMNDTQEVKEIMRAWLKQEGVTQQMFGIDGGYSGSGPFGVFRSLDPEFSTIEGDEQIRLIDSTYNDERRFNRRGTYSGVVDWMESLPKFTDRAQKVKKTEFGKFYVEAKERLPIEKMLAWTVQHAVWREMVKFDPELSPDMKGEDGLSESAELSYGYGSSKGWGDATDVPDPVALSMEHKHGKILFEEQISGVDTYVEWNISTKRYEMRLDTWSSDEVVLELPFGITPDQVDSMLVDIRTIVSNYGVTKEAQDQLRQLIDRLSLEKKEEEDDDLEEFYSDSLDYVEARLPGGHGPAAIYFRDTDVEIELPPSVGGEELVVIWKDVREILEEETFPVSAVESVVTYLAARFPGEEITQKTWSNDDVDLGNDDELEYPIW